VGSSEIVVLCGIDVYPTLIRDQYSHGWDGLPVNHPAKLGWVPFSPCIWYFTESGGGLPQNSGA